MFAGTDYLQGFFCQQPGSRNKGATIFLQEFLLIIVFLLQLLS
jgi:hypothetical protein